MSHYVALLRGINVGGNNLIKMTELKACFEEHGFQDVTPTSRAATYSSRRASRHAPLTRRIENVVARRSTTGEHGAALPEADAGHRRARPKASARSRRSTATTSSS